MKRRGNECDAHYWIKKAEILKQWRQSPADATSKQHFLYNFYIGGDLWENALLKEPQSTFKNMMKYEIMK